MPRQIDHIVILGSTLTALSLARHCRSLRITCDVVDTKTGPAAASAIPDVTLLETPLDSDVFESVTALARPNRSALIADSDAWLRWVVRFRADLESVFHLVLHPTNEVVTTCLDKSRFLGWCKENKLPAPQLFPTPGMDDLGSLDYPVLVRPKETLHGLPSTLPKAAEIKCDEKLGELLRQYDREGVEATICESLLRPRISQFSVGLVRNDLGQAKAIVAEKVRPPPEWCAGGTYVISRPDEGVHELAVAAANEIELYGIAEIEILKDEDTQELFLIEINPRPWVQYALSWKSGFDFLVFLLDPNQYRPETEATSGCRWISFKDDTYVALSRSVGLVKQGRITIRQYILDVLRANVFAYWSVSDMRPWAWKVMERFGKTRGS
jgi:predicted ATP-grasp superfamily ATP-dependent carboligase